MFKNLPQNALEFMDWSWSQIEPYYQELAERLIYPTNVSSWLSDWSQLSELVQETYQRLYVAITVDTTDHEAKRRHDAFLDEIYPKSQSAEEVLKEKILSSGFNPDGFAIPLQNLRAESEIFCEANLPLLSHELKLSAEYARIIGAQTIIWEGKEVTLQQLQPVYQESDRQKRQLAWRLAAERQMNDRQVINDLWVEFMKVREQIARNAGLPDFRTYRWKRLLRFDYTPEDCLRFHQAIEEVVVPAARRLYDRRREKLGLDSLRPWDLNVDVRGLAPLKPFSKVEQLIEKVSAIIKGVDPQLNEFLEIMRREGLLDLENRKGKAPGGYCTDFAASQRPFIFMNAVGLHDDVQTLIHEGGHAFHVFESVSLPYIQQKQVGLDFCEVASIGMELLASPYLTIEKGGFYTSQEAARARVEFLESAICFWPYMAVVDAFQHWVYQNPQVAIIPDNCDKKWAELWDRFMTGVDWSGLELEKVTGWQHKQHIHGDPFYYIEYGLAQLGAFQIWRNALVDQRKAVADYRKALSLGGTVPLPELFNTAGAKFSFDKCLLQEIVELAEKTLQDLESKISCA